MDLSIKLYSEKPWAQRMIGRWALQDELIPKDFKINSLRTNEVASTEILVGCSLDFVLTWLAALTKQEDEGEESVDIKIEGILNFWSAYDVVTHTKRLGFKIDDCSINTTDNLDETTITITFEVPISNFLIIWQNPHKVVASVTKESAQKKNEAPSTENEMLKELKAIIQQSKSELDMIKNIALFLKFDLQDTELLRRAYEDYTGLSKNEGKQLRAALAPIFNGKRLDHAMKELKKLFDQSQTAAAEFPDSQEVTAATSVSKESSETTSASTHTPPVHYDFDNVRDEEPPHTEEGQKGDGDDTSSEEDDDEEDPHT